MLNVIPWTLFRKFFRNITAICLLAAPLSLISQTPVDKSWPVLEAGLNDKKENKVLTLKEMGVIQNNPRAIKLALTALDDKDYEVRAAAASALGNMKAKSAADALASGFDTEKEPTVLIAKGHALIALGDERGYSIFYAILTGTQKSGTSLMDEQKKMLHDPKKLTEFGFEQGLGFIPFAGLGWSALKQLTKDDVSPVRAAAADILAKDDDPATKEALVTATSDKSWQVQAAAINALAQRNDSSTVPKILPWLDADKEVVRYAAAAAIIHLSDASPKPIKKAFKTTKKTTKH